MDGISDRELMRQAAAGVSLPYPHTLLKWPGSNLLVVGYVLGLQEPGKDFALGIREYIRTDADMTILRTVLTHLRDTGERLTEQVPERTWQQIEARTKPPARNLFVAIASGGYATLGAAIGGPEMAVLLGLFAGLLASKALEFYDRKLAAKLAGERAGVLLTLLAGEEVLKQRNRPQE